MTNVLAKEQIAYKDIGWRRKADPACSSFLCLWQAEQERVALNHWWKKSHFKGRGQQSMEKESQEAPPCTHSAILKNNADSHLSRLTIA